MRLTHIVVDIEATGPVPGLYSMTEIGAVALTGDLQQRFHINIRPLADASWQEGALRVLNTNMETLSARGIMPWTAMLMFESWLKDTTSSISGVGSRPVMVSDNPGFDFPFVAYYFWRFTYGNPLGHSSVHLGDFYKGIVRDRFQSFKHLRRTPHTHNALDDALGNAEALLEICNRYGIRGMVAG